MDSIFEIHVTSHYKGSNLRDEQKKSTHESVHKVSK